MEIDNAREAAIDMVSDDEKLRHRIDSLQQENFELKAKIETFRIKIKSLQEDNYELRRNSVNIQVLAEQEEEFISNKLFKKISELKKEKESLALNYEQEEEYLTNDLTRKLIQLQDEKENLEVTLEKEQELQVNKLMEHIQKLESEVMLKQKSLDTLRHEKIELENALEQEQEGLVNKLCKKLEKLESEKRILQSKLDLSLSTVFRDAPKSIDEIGSERFPTDNQNKENHTGTINAFTKSNECSEQDIDRVLSIIKVEGEHSPLVHTYIGRLKQEMSRLREIVNNANYQCSDKLQNLEREEKVLLDENKRLRKRLKAEIERRQEICRNLSESESSLEIDKERKFNEICRRRSKCNEANSKIRIRTVSDNIYLSNSESKNLRSSTDRSIKSVKPIMKFNKQFSFSQPCTSASSNKSQSSFKDDDSKNDADCDSMDQIFSGELHISQMDSEMNTSNVAKVE